ncbi:hypothetical protein QUF80_10340 [Desulfococcaceae bacterium HSG8]|nr:hypothetical protein [Desulfococcaceae bacterium HSG8]
MLNDELLFDIFRAQVEKSGTEKDLTGEEKERIIRVVRLALGDPFMDEHQIYPRLTGEEPI